METAAPLYVKVINAFKKRADVQNGKALGYRDNQDPNGLLRKENDPKAFGTGTTTTGYCVSASQALLLDKAFGFFLQTRGALAKLVSIDIKEMYWGNCYSGSQNKWHTAIYVEDGDEKLIVDITCAQFGGEYVEKYVWVFDTWEKTFRSASCSHQLTDFRGRKLGQDAAVAELPSHAKRHENVEMVRNLKDLNTLTDSERVFIADFLTRKIAPVNSKIAAKNITPSDFKYIDKLNNLIQKNMDVSRGDVPYFAIIPFDTKEKMVQWLENTVGANNELGMYVLAFPTIEDAANNLGIFVSHLDMPVTDESGQTYVVIEFDSLAAYEADFVKRGAKLITLGHILDFNIETDVYNSSIRNPKSDGRKTNTIIIKAKG